MNFWTTPGYRGNNKEQCTMQYAGDSILENLNYLQPNELLPGSSKQTLPNIQRNTKGLTNRK